MQITCTSDGSTGNLHITTFWVPTFCRQTIMLLSTPRPWSLYSPHRVYFWLLSWRFLSNITTLIPRYTTRPQDHQIESEVNTCSHRANDFFLNIPHCIYVLCLLTCLTSVSASKKVIYEWDTMSCNYFLYTITQGCIVFRVPLFIRT